MDSRGRPAPPRLLVGETSAPHARSVVVKSDVAHSHKFTNAALAGVCDDANNAN